MHHQVLMVMCWHYHGRRSPIFQVNRLRQVLWGVLDDKIAAVRVGVCLLLLFLAGFALVLIQVVDDGLKLDLGKLLRLVTAPRRHRS